jgi:3D-(3,5/4)-trihydroxycyclohexane-1,2-dione acylhydrolase (decyclizing)
LNWICGEKAAVVTSIGPGALHALAASLVPASDGLGVWYLLGDETSEEEGYNMQQIPSPLQNSFLKLFSTMGDAFTLHTPFALPAMLRRGLNTTSDPHRAGPFYLLLPMNIQAADLLHFNLRELPHGDVPGIGRAGDDEAYQLAAELLMNAEKVVVKIGNGGRKIGKPLEEFLELVDGVAVTSPISTGAIPASNERCMFVGGSKGSISGNYAMENADLLVAIGTRFVCQSDCSRTAYPLVKNVINLNTDIEDVTHYNNTLALLGDAGSTLKHLNSLLKDLPLKVQTGKSEWLRSCLQKRGEWQELKLTRSEHPALFDPVWGREVLTQPAAIKLVLDWAKTHHLKAVFDAGDVQANGFQLAEDETPNEIYNESGASYMGFAVSSLLATGIADQPFYAVAITGDGSLTMNPQILIDGVEHGAQGCIVLLDNRRMGAITGLQMDQYGHAVATSDNVEVDYVAWANSVKGIFALHGGYSPGELMNALNRVRDYPGLSLVHVRVYFGDNEMGGLGVYGRWNVGNWSQQVQTLRHEIGL